MTSGSRRECGSSIIFASARILAVIQIGKNAADYVPRSLHLTASVFSMMQAVGDLLFFAIIGVALAIAAWVLVMIVVPMYPASQASLAKSESAARLAVAALSNALPGQPARIDRRLGDNLYLYVNGGAFDEIPYANLKDAVEKIGRAWCDNVEYPWLATVGVYDIRSGKRLATHGCAFGKLKEAFLKPSSR